MYGIDAEVVGEELRKLVSDDDSRTEIRIRTIDADDAASAETRATSQLLDRFGTDLTRMAREGRIDPVIGREREIERVVQILSRRKKNNPILIGEAGVGKSAIVEGLALRIAAGEVPYTIAGKTLFSLDVSALVAGTKFRGEFEERMQQLLDELRKAQDTIIFIDEIHTIVGAGSTQGSLDTANILKPALARGELQTIGATTCDEYRAHIEVDAALERRFQKIVVEPTSPEQTLEILRNIAPATSGTTGCATRRRRCRPAWRSPTATSPTASSPTRRSTCSTRRGPAPTCRRHANRRPCGRRRPTSRRHGASGAKRSRRWSTKRPRRHVCGSWRCARGLREERAAWRHALDTRPATIAPEHIQQVVTAMTGIPAERVSDNELRRLRLLRDHLEGRVVGQREAVEKIARTIRRSRAGLKDERRPIGVFLFVGPTGVGKTLLAKEVSKWLFDEQRGLIRIDMSEYGEKHNVARLIGAPPGYVGYGDGGQLTEAVRRQPYAVVLFDEIEKAHPDVFNALLQIFDEGHLTDGSGRRVDFRNTILIMTSNVGSRETVQRPKQVGYSTPSKSGTEELAPACEYRRALEQTFAPEFLNRIDDIVIFRTLEAGDVERIVDLELQGLFSRTRRLGYEVRITRGAKRRLAAMGYEQRYGARALKRTLADHVEEPLSELIIEGRLQAGDTVVVESDKRSGVRLRVA